MPGDGVSTKKVYVIHENPIWLPPFAAAFNRIQLDWAELNLSSGTFDLSSEPPQGIFYNRMSASSHTRGHRYSAELTAAVLAWLTRWGRTVVNGPRALDLEISKVRQYSALEAAGLSVPRTVLVMGSKADLIKAAQEHFSTGPVILKPNRGGKGLGVRLFLSVASLVSEIDRIPADEAPVDGIYLLQEYVKAVRPVITRAEFIGGRFVYAVEVDTSAGFELCPADVCAVKDDFCPAGPSTDSAAAAAPPASAPAPSAPVSLRFTVLKDGIESDLIARIQKFLLTAGIDVAGVEFIRHPDGRVLIYDVNTNTNYNAGAEEVAGIAATPKSGPGALAEYLASLSAAH